MSNELAATAIGPIRGNPRQVGADELVQGLLLVRASAIKVVRFQLAMERRDRRVALEAVDDLVTLDRKIEDFLGDLPGSVESRHALEHELEQQRQALIGERFTLTAGISGRIATGRDSRAAGAAVAPAAEPTGAEEALILAEPAGAAETGRSGISSRLLAAGLILAMIATGLLVIALLQPDLIGGSAWIEGVLR